MQDANIYRMDLDYFDETYRIDKFEELFDKKEEDKKDDDKKKEKDGDKKDGDKKDGDKKDEDKKDKDDDKKKADKDTLDSTEERRVGNECVSTSRSRWRTNH